MFHPWLILFITSIAFVAPLIADTSQKKNLPIIPREILFGYPEKAAPQLSPDGTRLAYLAPDSNQVLNVWLRDLDKTTEEQLITSDKKRGIRNFRWQYDCQHILYIQDRDGDENWHLYQTNIQTKVTKDLTPFEGVRAELLAYEPKFPNDILVQLNMRHSNLFDIYRINLKDGSIECELENHDNIHHWLADHQLQVRVAQLYDKKGETIIRVRDNKDTPWRELMRWGPEESQGSALSFSANGQDLYVISSLEANTGRLLKVNLAQGSKETIVQDAQYDLSVLIENPTSHTIEAVGIEKDRLEWIVLDPAIKEDFAFLNKKEGITRIISRDLNDQRWVVMYSDDCHPSQFYLYDRIKKQSQFLFNSRPQLEQYQLSSMTPLSFPARDGMELHGYLTLPLEKEPKNLPTVLLVHGGPWTRDSWGFNPQVQWLANRGYAVLQINYRGSTGYGKKHLNAGNREWAGKMHLDLLDGKQWMIDQGYADPNKVAIYGGSYGGYAALVGLTFTPEEFCCGVSIVGPSNLVTLLQTIPPYWSPAKSNFDIRVGNIETDREFLESRSPLFKADKISRPLLIAQGANDPRVKQAESDQIVTAIQKNHKEVEYILFPDEGHGFARPENQLKFFAAAERFLNKYLGGKVQSSHTKEEK